MSKIPLSFMAVICLTLIALSACAPASSQNRYSYQDVGQTTTVTFGTVVASRFIDIAGRNTGTGAALGAGIGGGAASYIGSGSGNIWAMAGGALAGAAIGAMSEQALANRKGIEYTVTLETGLTMTVVQESVTGDVLIAPGSRVMVQNSGSYQRVLPADHLPEAIKRPKRIELIDD